MLGPSAAIAGTEYELTAETAVPCQVNFIPREPLLDLISRYGEAGLRSAQALSREFQSAYRDIHDLILARSSAGKLAKLLLSWTPPATNGAKEIRVRSGLTHEEMAQMIGARRNSVSLVASTLQQANYIHYSRGHIEILDLDGLSKTACECYASVKTQYERLLRPRCTPEEAPRSRAS